GLPTVAVAALVIATFLGHTFLGPVAALLQSLAGVRRRAMAAAFYLFLVNLVSMGVGPTAVGFASDRFAARFGSAALRCALFAAGLGQGPAPLAFVRRRLGHEHRSTGPLLGRGARRPARPPP